MFSVPDFLDRAKRGAGVESDYALAKRLGVNKANVSGWRLERVAPDERSIVALCQLSGDDPEHVAACIQSMRAANDDAADLWRRVAARLQKGAAVVTLLPSAAIFFLALYSDRTWAAVDWLRSSHALVCILCLIGAGRLLMRVGALSYRTARPRLA